MDIEGIKRFFEPNGVALIGATDKIGFGYGQTKTLIMQGLGKRLFLVNPSRSTVFGIPTCQRVSDIPGPVDLAVVIVPARAVPPVLKECASKGIKAAIVQSAGFAEIGPEGRDLQEELTRICRQTGMRIIGPNCVGVANTANGFTTTEATEEAMRPGHVGIIAQSGVFGNILMDWGPDEGVSFSKVATLGNRCDVDESELLLYLGGDEQTRVIAMYLESVADGRRFVEALREVSPKKPVIVLKSGRTPEGKMATASHTASLSGDDQVYDGIFNQLGVIRARDIQELFELAKAFAHQPIPVGSGVAIVTTSGSLGAMAVDSCSELGLEMAPLSARTIEVLKDGAPQWMNVKNPLDVGPSGLFFKGLKALLEEPRVDGVIAIFVIPWLIVKEVESLGAGAQGFLEGFTQCRNWMGRKPVFFTVVGKRELRGRIQGFLGQDVPILSSPQNAARAFWAMKTYGTRSRKTKKASELEGAESP